MLRAIPIIIQTQLLINNGLPEAEAAQSAKVLFLETPVWNAVFATIQGIIFLIIIFFMIRFVEKKHFFWKDIGLNWNHTSLYNIGLGFVVACLVYFAPIFLGFFLGTLTLSFQDTFENLVFSSVFMTVVFNFSIGFGEEVVFRSYIQTRMIKLYGAILGILLTSILFTLSHVLMTQLSLISILTGIILFVAIGILYFCTHSLYLVGTIHAVLNILQQILDKQAGDIEGLAVVSVFFLVVFLIFFRKLKTEGKEQYKMSDSTGTA